MRNTIVPHGTVSGYGYHKCRCTECSQAKREYMRAYFRKRRADQKDYAWNRYVENRDAIDRIKLATGCQDCGYDKHPCALDFDHVTGDKLFSIGMGKSLSWERIQLEINKCEVVCANCHRIRTSDRRKEKK